LVPTDSEFTRANDDRCDDAKDFKGALTQSPFDHAWEHRELKVGKALLEFSLHIPHPADSSASAVRASA
jgi:hypothetical protein